MKPKPSPEEHKRALLRALTAGLERACAPAAQWLRAHEDRFTLVSWTHLFYSIRRDIRRDLPGLERLLAHPIASEEERRDLDSFARRLGRLRHLVGDSVPALTGFLAGPELEATLAEVARYLRNEKGVAVGIRALLESALMEAWRSGERVMLIGHSLGSVVAYDCLWELSREAGAAGKVDHFVTIGSPLATRYIRRAVKGAGEPLPRRYPSNIRRWTNFASRGERVALHRSLAPFFGAIVEAGLAESLQDCPDLYNHFHGELGLDPHKCYGYLIHERVAGLVGNWVLDVS